MDNNLSSFNSVAVVIVAIAVGKMLAGRAPLLRWTATLIAAVVVGGALGFSEKYMATYSQKHDPAAASAYIEKELISLSPMLVPIVKEGDPQAWSSFISRIGQKVAASGGNPSAEDTQQASLEMREMFKSLWPSVSMADDATIVALNRQEIIMDETLQRETIKMCATRGNTLWNLNDLPPESLKAVQKYMALLGLAYRQGKGKPINLLTDDQAGNLVRQALSWKDSPISSDDAAYMFSDDNTDPARKCRLKLQLDKNISVVPDKTKLLRWLYAHSGDS